MRSLPPLLLAFALLLGVAGCGSYEEEIAQVKAARTGGVVNERLVNEVAGARGSVEWSAEAAGGNEYASGADVVRVTARIEKPGGEGRRTAELAWIVNRGTQQIALEGVTVDGRAQSLAGGALEMLLLRLE